MTWIAQTGRKRTTPTGLICLATSSFFVCLFVCLFVCVFDCQFAVLDILFFTSFLPPSGLFYKRASSHHGLSLCFWVSGKRETKHSSVKFSSVRSPSPSVQGLPFSFLLSLLLLFEGRNFIPKENQKKNRKINNFFSSSFFCRVTTFFFPLPLRRICHGRAESLPLATPD